jgi:hypothetical protein
MTTIYTTRFSIRMLSVVPTEYTGHTQNNGTDSRVIIKCISYPTLAQHTLSVVVFVYISHALTAVRTSCLLRGRGTGIQDGVAAGEVSVYSVLRCPDLWLQCSVSFVPGLKDVILVWCVLFKQFTKLTLHSHRRSGQLKKGAHRKPSLVATPFWKLVPRPRSKHEKRTAVAHKKYRALPLLTVYVVPMNKEK